jgi:hypothetical protein
MPSYSFQNVTATLIGPTGIIDLGYGAAVAEEGITIAMAEDKNTMLIGADGEGMHSLHAGKSGQVTVRLLKTSSANAKLMLAYDVQTADAALHGQNLIAISMPNVGDVSTARSCAFKKKPDLEYAKDGQVIEWVFDALKIDTLLGKF